MKKKSTTYILIAAVFGLWGMIGYKVFKAFKSPETDSKKPITIMLDDFKKSQPAYDLLPQYPDPFLKGGFIEMETTDNSDNFFNTDYDALEIPYQEENQESETAYFPTVVYKGVVKPNSNNKKTYLIQLNHKSEIFSLNEERDGVKIISGNREKIKVRYNGIIKEFSIQ